jgi:hypothetical protein
MVFIKSVDRQMKEVCRFFHYQTLIVRHAQTIGGREVNAWKLKGKERINARSRYGAEIAGASGRF